jgi:alpha-ketoglutarate-dependent taurine dioxygenase
MKVVKLGEHIGARVDGVSLDGDLGSDAIATINEALVSHRVIFFRGQHHLDDDGQYAFARRLGIPTAPHPTLKADGGRVLPVVSTDGRGASNWHTDVTFVDRIPKASILRPVALPPYGGTTIWASTIAGYQQLPQPLQTLADSLWAVHNNQFDYAQLNPAKLTTPTHRSDATLQAVAEYAREFSSRHFETRHPVVRVHPETGERALLLGAFTKQILDVNVSESRALFGLFEDRITQLENTIRWNWELGDVAIWDNRATQHYAVSDYGSHPRRMHRITLAGDIPVNVQGERSRVIAGDAADYSVIDDPKQRVA